VQNKTKLMTL